MRSRHRPDNVERVIAICRPVADRLIHRVLQRGTALRDRMDPRAQHLHALDIGRLPFDVKCAHEHFAFHPKQRRDGRRGDAVHARTGLGNETTLPHPPGEKRLTDRVIHFVRTRMVQVLSLQNDPGAAQMLREALRIRQRALPSDIMRENVLEFGSESRIPARLVVGRFEFVKRGHQRFGDILSAVDSVMRFHCSPFSSRSFSPGCTALISVVPIRKPFAPAS